MLIGNLIEKCKVTSNSKFGLYVEVIIAIFIIIFYLMIKYAFNPNLTNFWKGEKGFEIFLFFVTFGAMHILSRHVLAYAYNLQKKIFFVVPTVTPQMNIIIGIASLAFATTILITNKI
ncbi:hypothetical protein [Desulfosediminicola ganghwensis]|uniref:hypothetical protein n=1 Tax=Desulfosediminicola ganghwensis TaxID=2569540 RepID=UPI0010ACB75B|nr:hypothetical protein [Desulfosediminicola ganghwensis]